MFDLGWTELMLIGIVALIVVGPRDLPGMFRTLGQLTGKARGMAREFTRAMEQAANDSGVNDINKTLRAVASPRTFAADQVKRAAGIGTPASTLPKAGTPVAPAAAAAAATAPAATAPATPAVAAAPAAPLGPATEALAEKRKAERERLEAEFQARAVARRAAEAERAPKADTSAEGEAS